MGDEEQARLLVMEQRGYQVQLGRVEFDIQAQLRTIQDMSPIAAEAMKSAAESQFARPAIEATRRAKEESRRWYVSGALFAGVLIAAFAKLDGGALAGVLVALATVLGGAKIVEELKKRSPPT